MMKNNNAMVVLVLVIFFAISFITNIMGPIFPSLVTDFNISVTVAGFLPFSFFIAYGVMSIPSGILVDSIGEKKVILYAFLLSMMGSLFFVLMPSFIMAMSALFLIGSGMAMLQVAINPLLRVAGGQQNFAFYSVLAQLFFGGAAALSPLLYRYIVQGLTEEPTSGLHTILEKIVPNNMQWLSMYWVFFLVSLLMIIIVSLFNFPKVQLEDEEKVGSLKVIIDLLKNKTVLLFLFSIIAYVGTEQGIANAISLFLKQHHGLEPETIGAKIVSEFWLMLTLGCLLGLFLVKIIDSRLVLKLFSLGAIASLTFSLFGNKDTALIAFPLIGFFLSVMWSVIFSLALNSLPNHHGSFAGILCTGIVGGGLVSPIIGLVAELSGDLRMGFLVVYMTLAYIFSIGFWAKPLVLNKLFFDRKQ